MRPERLAVDLVGSFFIACILCTGRSAAGQSSFTLGFEGPAVITGGAGNLVQATYYLTLRGSNSDAGSSPHANAWNVAVHSSRGQIVGMGVDRTWGEAARTDGFLRMELTTGHDNEGAVMQAVYSLDPIAALPVAHEQVIASIVVEVTVLAGLPPLLLEYQDRLRGSFGVVDNVIEEDGRAVAATLEPKQVEITFPEQDTVRSFTLGLDAPFSLQGEPGTSVKGELPCVLRGDFHGISQAAAWSMGIQATGGRITGITVEGTDAEPALTKGFVRNELTAGPGNEGAISTVIYSAAPPQLLSTGQGATIARIEVEAPVMGSGAPMMLEYRDGLVGEFGPIANTVLAAGGVTENPLLTRTPVSVLSSRRCGDVAVGFSTENMDSPIPFDRVVGGSAAAGEIIVPVPEGEVGTVELFAALVSMFAEPAVVLCDGHGTTAWSFAVALDGDAIPLAATFAGTAAEGYMGAGFSTASIQDLNPGEGTEGFVVGVILSFQGFSCLPAIGSVSTVRMVIQAQGPQGPEDTVARLSFAPSWRVGETTLSPGYVGRGDVSLPFCNREQAALTVRFRKASTIFRRGDANADRRIDLSDAVAILGGLFLGDALDVCEDAWDADDNGELTLTDPVYLLRYLFVGGPSPPPPFPGCGEDPSGDQDGVTCRTVKPACQ